MDIMDWPPHSQDRKLLAIIKQMVDENTQVFWWEIWRVCSLTTEILKFASRISKGLIDVLNFHGKLLKY